MAISGNLEGDVLALAEGPGEEEDRKGEALIGPSGKLLRDQFPRVHRDRVAYQNIVRCRPDSNRTPTLAEAHACSVHLNADIAAMPNLRAILGVGAVPLRRFFPTASIMRVHGLKFPVAINNKTYWYYPVMHPAFILHGNNDYKYENPALPVFQADIRNFFKTVDRWEKPHVEAVATKQVLLPKSRAEAEALLAKMRDPVAVDLESSKLRPYEKRSELLTAAFSDGVTTIAFSCNHPEGPTSWGADLLIDTICKRRWIAHNAAMELSWFKYYNKTGKPIQPYDDSMALVRLYHERESVIDLGQSSHIHLGVNVKQLAQVDPSRIMDYPLAQILPYNGLDALASAFIYKKLHDKVNRDGYARIIGSIEATTAMELEGLPIDLVESARLKKVWEEKQLKIRADARKLHEVRQYEADRGVEFKITSPEQVGVALVSYGKLDLPLTNRKDGKTQYSTDEEILSKYADANPLARAVLDDREAGKIISTYIDPTLKTPERYPDGMLHPTYTTMLVSTLRLSSRDPNIQNWPSRKHSEIRKQIALIRDEMIRRYGRMMIMAKFDYGQLEARILAMASKDKNLVRSIIEKFDIHSYWLDQVLDVYPIYIDRLADKTGQTDEKKVRKAGRDVIKSDFVFNALYGGGADSIAERTGIPLRYVNEVLGFLWETYRGVKTWHKERRAEYRDTGAISTLTKRVRRGILDGNEPINTPIQGLAADIVMEAMNEVSAYSRKVDDFCLHPRIQLHDDLTFMLPEDNAEEYIDIIHPILTKIRFPFQIVPLTAELKVGYNWTELNEVATFAGDYVR
jgi:uracil-DNA glycosylase family 4